MNNYIELIKKMVTVIKPRILPKQEEGQSKKEYHSLLLIKGVEAAVFLFAAMAIVKGSLAVLPDSITVSSSVNGRELPIYCVETDKKQIALTFDAACAGS